MLKRILIATGCLLLSGSLLLLIWQPDAAKKALFDHVARTMTMSTPYELTVDRVSGNIFTGFSLHGLRLHSRSNQAELLRAPTVGVGVSWVALFHKTITLQHLTCDKLTLFNPSSSPARELILCDIDLRLRINVARVDINSLQMRMDEGRARLHGWLQRGAIPSGELELADENIPVHKILAFMQPVPSTLRLVHSGQWIIRDASGTIHAVMDGRLARAPVSLRGVWDQKNSYYRADLQWTQASLYDVWEDPTLKSVTATASLNIFGHGLSLNGQGRLAVKGTEKQAMADAQLQFSEGVGDYTVHVSSGNNRVALRGQLNLPHQFMEGRASAENIVWQNVHIGKMNASFRVSRLKTHLDWVGQQLLVTGAGNPGDISSLHLTLDGLSPHWQSTLTASFKEGSSVVIAGHLTQGSHDWRFAWQKWIVSLPSTPSWASRQPGSVVWSDRQIELRHVDFASGGQSLKVDEGIWQKDFIRFDLAAHNIDLAPWAGLLLHDVSLSQATLDATLRVDGAKSNPHVEGFVNGKIQSLTAPTAGLNVQNITLEVRHTGEIAEIHAAGKMKKGDIQISGSAPWPRLNYELHVRDLKVSPTSKSNAEGDVDIHVGGTLASPVVTGAIHIDRGTYSPVPDKKKQQASAINEITLWPQGTLDVSLQWPRDVWYRDGASAIETTGNLRFQKREGSSIVLLTGSVRSIRGDYSYFGRNFTLESGEIQFVGSPELNPSLNVEASYASGATTVYLDITGTADKPALKMHSNPPLSDQDIVSVIVFGQPLNELRTRSGGTNSNQEMMQAAGGVLGSYLSKGLNQTGVPLLNFDVLNIQPADAGGSQLTVGRYLSRKLFISYGQTVQGSAEKTMTADYFLTPKWTLQGASDSVEGNYLDFLFRYPLNKAGSASNNSPLPKSPFRNALDQPTLTPSFRSPMQ